MKKAITILLTTVLVLTLASCSKAQTANNDTDRETIYQVALLQSLTQGYFDGIITVGELKEHGDTGIGTFEGVNGEMIVLDGTVYQALGDGTVKEADDSETVPFSNVTFFETDGSVTLSDITDINTLKEQLNAAVEKQGGNMFYMIKISGNFEKMYVRSEWKQEKPYRTLDEALSTDQTEFHYENINGTIVGLYCPDYMSGLNATGWHFHFVSEDHSKGGHILDLTFDKAEAVYDTTPTFAMCLSDNGEFQGMELSKDVSEAIKQVETGE